MKVYIAMNGSYGCIPDNFQVFTSAKDAEDYLIDLFDIHRTRLAGNLRRYGYIDLDPKYGANYAEVTKSNMSKEEFEEQTE